MRVDTLALAIGGLGFLGFGALMLVAPQIAMASLGLVVPDGVPTTEIRAFYGGLELGLGALLLAACRKVQYQRAGLVLGCVSYGSVATARALGMLIDGTGGGFLWAALGVETSLALLFWYALRRNFRPM
jgi:hypothetical protein